MTGYALATALAAPVDDGTMFAEAARPARQSAPFMEPSTVSCEAVGSARGARDDVHGCLVVLLVDADDDGGRLGVLGWGRNDDFLCAALHVLHASFSGGESSCRLANVLNASVLPWNLGWVARGREADGQAVDDEPIVGQLNGIASTAKTAVDCVVFKQILHVLWRHRRVNVLQYEVFTVHCNTGHLATDTAEAVDAKLDGCIGVGRHLGRRTSARTRAPHCCEIAEANRRIVGHQHRRDCRRWILPLR